MSTCLSRRGRRGAGLCYGGNRRVPPPCRCHCRDCSPRGACLRSPPAALPWPVTCRCPFYAPKPGEGNAAAEAAVTVAVTAR